MRHSKSWPEPGVTPRPSSMVPTPKRAASEVRNWAAGALCGAFGVCVVCPGPGSPPPPEAAPVAVTVCNAEVSRAVARSGEDPSKYLLALKMCEVCWYPAGLEFTWVSRKWGCCHPRPYPFLCTSASTGPVQALETIVSRPCSFAFMPEETSFVQVAKELAGSSVLLGGS